MFLGSVSVGSRTLRFCPRKGRAFMCARNTAEISCFYPPHRSHPHRYAYRRSVCFRAHRLNLRSSNIHLRSTPRGEEKKVQEGELYS